MLYSQVLKIYVVLSPFPLVLSSSYGHHKKCKIFSFSHRTRVVQAIVTHVFCMVHLFKA